MDRFDALRAFVAVADEGGFAAAARRIGMSPPAVTRLVAALEQHLGQALFRRSTRLVSLTDEGAAFLGRARTILSDLRDAEHMMMGGRDLPRGQLHVTAPVQFGRLHVLPVIAAMLEAHPDLSARLMLIDRNVRIVEEGIDVAVRIGPLSDSSLRRVSIGSVSRMLVASPAYLERHGRPRDPASLAAHAAIASIGVRELGSWTVQGVKVRIRPRLTVNTVEAAIAAAEAGLGIANLLSYQVADAIGSGRLLRIFEGGAEDRLPVSLLFDQGRSAMPSVCGFIDAMRARHWARSWDGSEAACASSPDA